MGLKNFLKKIFQPVQNNNMIAIYLKDNKCNEKIKILVRKSYDIQRIYEEGEEVEFRLNKVVICNKCYNKIYVKLDFDRNYNIIKKEVNGGEIISEEEYNKEETGCD